MKQKTIIKIPFDGYKKRQLFLFVNLTCFLIAFFILMLYLSKLSFLLIIPIAFLIFKIIIEKKKRFFDASCIIENDGSGSVIIIKYLLLSSERDIIISSKDILRFRLKKRRVEIIFKTNNNCNKILVFFINPEDAVIWNDFSNNLPCLQKTNSIL